MIILVIVAIFCLIGAAAISVVLFIWYRKKQAAEQAHNTLHTAPAQTTSPTQEEPVANYAAFAPPPSSSPVAQQSSHPQNDSDYNQQTIDLVQPPLSDHISELDAIEPMSESFPKSEIEDIVPQAPLDTLDADPMTELESELNTQPDEDEIGENDATVLMQRPSRPES